MALIPNPVGDLLKRVEGTLGNVDAVMPQVEQTVGEATAVLVEVRSLLAELQEDLQLIRQVPEMAARLDEIHAAVRNGRP